jgi:transcriptional regulator with XRE-family HTH domain
VTGSPELGAWLRQQREDRYWSRIELARRMIKVASRHDDTPPPCTDHLAHNIYRWEHGKAGPSERYRLYWCEATGITPDQFGIPTTLPEVRTVCAGSRLGQ